VNREPALEPSFILEKPGTEIGRIIRSQNKGWHPAGED